MMERAKKSWRKPKWIPLWAWDIILTGAGIVVIVVAVSIFEALYGILAASQQGMLWGTVPFPQFTWAEMRSVGVLEVILLGVLYYIFRHRDKEQDDKIDKLVNKIDALVEEIREERKERKGSKP